MIRIYLLFVSLSLIFISCKTTQKAKTVNPTIQYLFPLDWIGDYEGELHIFNNSGDTTKVKMQLTIDNPNAEGYYPWIIRYGEDDIRAYGLEAINAERGHYVVDEFNSIRLDGYLRDNHFITRFGVMTSDLLVDYERVAEGILVHLYITGKDPINTTGGEIFAKDTVPIVRSFPIPVFQSALLKKR